MTLLKVAGILALTAGAFLALSCGGAENTSNSQTANAGGPAANANANAAGSNVEELGVIVNVPYEAEDVAWKQSPDKKKVLAVLRFSDVDSNKVVSEAEASGPPSQVAIPSESWFPDELVAQSDVSGDSTLKGMAYPANRFFLEPYTDGRITRVEGTDFFILELTSK